MEKKVMYFDVAEIIKAKVPNKKFPKFIVNYLKRILHQDELNAFFARVDGVKNVDFIEKAVNELVQVSADFEGIENLPPKEGRYIFVSNHPLGGLDSVILGLLLGRKYDNKVKYFANDILMFLEPMNEMFLPVNKGGKGHSPRENAKAAEDFFNSENHLITFPAGTCSRKIGGKIQDLPWKKTFVSKAVQSKRDVIPIYFDGKNSDFFYNLSIIRTKLGLPNIEMLYLVNEMFKQKGNHFNVKIGKLIPYQTFDNTKTPAEWAAWVKGNVYELVK
ncbi:MAG: 1-acyl-sn-glycerol-3-phosphate acyltransferase [Paludibacteraceae bacterium]